MDSVDVEIILKNYSTISETDIIRVCSSYLSTNQIAPGTIISEFDNTKNAILHDEVDHLLIGELTDQVYIDCNRVRFYWYVYTLDKNGPQIESSEDEGGEVLNLASHCVLPSLDLFTQWENLIYDSRIKEDLLKYAYTMMEFSDRRINSNIITCNRVILLHGPPGTGKTSLCRALAHKLSIRMQRRFKHAVLIEINSHSLFSKWFSESGKLVTKLFTKIKEIVEETRTLVCVLIDEVESLAHAREQCMSGNEPSDSIRVVNAVLTQIDQIKRYPNVLILTTSNMTGAIDIAFVDRADIKQYVDLPGVEAIYRIYYSCIEELLRVGVIHSNAVFQRVNVFNVLNCINLQYDVTNECTLLLIRLSEKSLGLSGRTLRKIPFLAHALYLNKEVVNLKEFVEAMNQAVEYEMQQRKHFANKDSNEKM